MIRVLTIAIVLSSAESFAHGKKHIHGEEVKKEPTVDVNVHQEISDDYKSTIEPIFKGKCFDCHSAATKYPWYYKVPVVSRIMDFHIKEARSHLDMSKGFPFVGHGGVKGDLKEIVKVVDGDEMPPWYYTPFHGDSKLNKKEKKAILLWARSSLTKIEIQERKQ